MILSMELPVFISHSVRRHFKTIALSRRGSSALRSCYTHTGAHSFCLAPLSCLQWIQPSRSFL